MTDDKKKSAAAANLRSKARTQPASQAAMAAFTAAPDTKRLLYELQVYQAELEMQNEELQRAVAEKTEHAAHLHNIIAQTPAGYFRIDREGYFVDVNDSWLRMHGYDSRDEVVGKHFRMMQVDSGSVSALAHLAELQRGVAIPVGEFVSRRKDGSIGRHVFSAHPVVQFDQIVGYEWFIIDVSDRFRLEAENQLIERQFQQAQKLESLGVLAGGIAHDFNNLLAIIIGHCSLAKLKPETAEKHFLPIQTAAEKAAELCKQMLTYAGKSPLVQTQIDMRKLLTEMISLLKATIKQNVRINASLSPESTFSPFITGDAGQLRQVVMNLILNAAEAIGEAQGKVSVSLAPKEIKAGQADRDHLDNTIPAGCYLCLQVTDNGCGMGDEARQRIFEPFYSTKFVGRGLGMSAVLGIITTHKGALQLISQPGRGTAFKVYLPVLDTAAVADAPSPDVVSAPWQGRGTLLLVEDEKQLLAVTKTMLETLGFSVLEAVNGKVALELYQQHAADITLVLTDLGMPVMDGYELFCELKKLDPDLPIILSSGFDEIAVNSRLVRAKLCGQLSKPYSIGELRDELKRVMEG
jgi:PAS domain S-box-containing protein